MDMLLGGFGAGLIFILIIALAIRIIFLVSLQNALKKVRPQFQTMPPGQVWLLLIPLFNYVWEFIVVTRVAESIGAEFRDRGLPGEEKPGYGIGMAMAACSAASFLLGLITNSGISDLLTLAAFVLWIIYWVRIYNYSKQLEGGILTEDAPLDSGHSFTREEPRKPDTSAASDLEDF